MTRALAVIAALAMVFSLMSGLTSAYGATSTGTSDGFTYTELSDGTVSITGYTGQGGDVTIPSTLDGMTVSTIGDDAFQSCTSLTSLTIPEGVTSFANFSFAYCTSLTSITIPSTVTSMGDAPLVGCTSLTSITVAAGNTSYSAIGGALYSDGGTVLVAYPSASGSVTIPEGVTSIGNGAFAGCTSLTSVTIPEGVTSIGYDAFAACTSLTAVTIPSTITAIEYGTFASCTSLTSVTIPDSVTSIESFAFEGCTSLTSVTFPSSASLGTDVFSGSGIASVSSSGGTTTYLFASIPDQVWTGSAVTPDVTITLGGTTLIEGTDHTASYSDNVSFGTATVTLTGIGAYTGTASRTFTITATPAQSFSNGDIVTIANTVSGKVVEAAGAAITNALGATMYTSNGSAAQEFVVSVNACVLSTYN